MGTSEYLEECFLLGRIEAEPLVGSPAHKCLERVVARTIDRSVVKIGSHRPTTVTHLLARIAPAWNARFAGSWIHPRTLPRRQSRPIKPTVDRRDAVRRATLVAWRSPVSTDGCGQCERRRRGPHRHRSAGRATSW